MKKTTLLTILAAGMLLAPVLSMAQTTASGTLTVNATVQSSITLMFNSNASGKALSSGAGTNAATLDFGNISAYGAVAGGITRTVGAANFTVSTPFDIQVNKNGASLNYSLTAQLGAADATNTWTLGATQVTSGPPASLTTTGAYGSSTYTLNLAVPLTTAAGAISNTINFLATAN